MKVIFFLILSSAAWAKVSTIKCDTIGSTFLNLELELARDLQHDISDNGYELFLTTSPKTNFSNVKVIIESGAQVVFRTEFTVDYTSQPKTLFKEYVDDFLLSCSTN